MPRCGTDDDARVTAGVELMATVKKVSPDAVPAPTSPEQRHHVARTAGSDLTFGVLRRHYPGIVNSAVTFGWNKLHPIAPTGEPGPGEDRCWQPTACRSTVLLPPGASDMLWSPQALLEAFERQPRTDRKDLAVVLKLHFTDTASLYQSWKRTRDFADAFFVEQHGLPVVLALHVPSQSGSRTAAVPHAHVMALAQALGPHGFGSFCTLACDAAHAVIEAAWRDTA